MTLSALPKLVLLPGKQKNIIARHHWIFSGAVQSCDPCEAGATLAVHSFDGQPLGYAYSSKGGSIVARMVSFSKNITPEKAVPDLILRAVAMRRSMFDEAKTNCWRVVHGEGDGLPGLVVDRYADILVIQISTVGMERLKPLVIAELKKAFPGTRAIYEHSNLPSRRKECMADFSGVLDGQLPEATDVIENGVIFRIIWKEVQKTGFFLDQREMRKLIGSLSQGKRVLNCFSYTGGFSAYAAVAGATRVDSVDIAAGAVELSKTNFSLNGVDPIQHGFYAEDVFRFLREKPLSYELVILDPPAFAKKKEDIEQAAKGYKDINMTALKKMPSGSLLLTCSCSYFMDESLFQTVIFQAARDANRTVRIIQKHHLAPDHPINIFHPEGDYLKSLLLYVE